MKPRLAIFLFFTFSVMAFSACTGPVTEQGQPTASAQSKSSVSITVDPPGGNASTQNTDWQAEQGAPQAEGEPFVNIYFVAVDDGGKSGRLIGCNDSLVPVQAKYGLLKDEGTAKDTLTKLFAVKQQNYGDSGLYNALYQSDLKVDSLTATSTKKATLQLSGTMTLGGVCDNPRFEEQIRETVLQFKNLYSSVDIYVNGKPLKDLLSEK